MIYLKNNEYSYAPKEKLGKGSFGSVYKCTRTVDGKKFAAKLIAKNQFDKPGGAYLNKCFQREIAIHTLATQSKIPFFVELVEKIEDDQFIYLILELCEQNLLEHTCNKLLSEEVALEFIFQVGIGLNYLHSIQISHRDIKMENIMIKEGILKITDFGFASQNKMMTTNLGTPTFMGPEFYHLDVSNYSPKIDVWALNTCLYYFLTNKLYFMSQNASELKRIVLEKQFVIGKELEYLKPTTKDLLTKGYIKDMDRRPSMEEYITHPAFSFLNAKYQIFLDKTRTSVLQDIPTDSLKIPDIEGDNQEYLNYLLNFRNNTLIYQQMSERLLELGFNLNFCFLLMKRALQNIGAILTCFQNKSIPRFRNFERIVVNDKEWAKFCSGHWFKLLSSVYVSDFKKVLPKYSQMYKNLLNALADIKNTPSFDLNDDESQILTYFCNEIISKIRGLTKETFPNEFKMIVKYAQRLLIYEKYSMDQMVLAHIPIR